MRKISICNSRVIARAYCWEKIKQGKENYVQFASIYLRKDYQYLDMFLLKTNNGDSPQPLLPLFPLAYLLLPREPAAPLQHVCHLGPFGQWQLSLRLASECYEDCAQMSRCISSSECQWIHQLPLRISPVGGGWQCVWNAANMNKEICLFLSGSVTVVKSTTIRRCDTILNLITRPEWMVI